MGKTQELREAFLAGAKTFCEWTHNEPVGPFFRERWQYDAEQAYPIPTETRPRVLTLPNGDGQYRVVEGQIVYRYDADDEWGAAWFDRARVAALAELLANPTETVEVDE